MVGSMADTSDDNIEVQLWILEQDTNFIRNKNALVWPLMNVKHVLKWTPSLENEYVAY